MQLEEVTCELAANKTGYIIRGFTGISASQTITLNTIAENPPVATNYKIQVFSFSSTYNAMIDEAFGYINILNQCKVFILILKFTLIRWCFKGFRLSFLTMD